jgi:hypothetical protein
MSHPLNLIPLQPEIKWKGDNMRMETVTEKPTKFRPLGCNKHAGEHAKVGGENIVGVMHYI